MKFKSIISFFQGIIENTGNESRIPENSLVKQHNVDVELTGKLVRRYGYTRWTDLTDSRQSYLGPPDNRGFGNKVQAIYPFTDYEGNHYIIVVANGKIYIERYLNGEREKIWECLNPSGNLDLLETIKRIEITSYLDTVFINDPDNNIYIYDPNKVGSSGFTSINRRYIYFANRRIYFRSNVDFSAALFTEDITSMNFGAQQITIAGDYTHYFKSNDKITLTDTVSGANTSDGEYTLNGDATFGGGATTITTNEAFPFDTGATGTVSSRYRIYIEDGHGANFEAQPIADSLAAIDFYGAGDVITTLADLYLGLGVRIGNDNDGYYFLVLEHSTDERSEAYVYLIRFNDRFIAQDYIRLDSVLSHKVIDIGYINNQLFVYCKAGEFNIIDQTNLLNTVINSNEVQYATAVNTSPPNFAITAIEDSVFLYSNFISLANMPTRVLMKELEPGAALPKIKTTTQNVFGSTATFDGTYYWVKEHSFNNAFVEVTIKKVDTDLNLVDSYFFATSSYRGSTFNLSPPELLREDRAGTYHYWFVAGTQLVDFDSSTGGMTAYSIPGVAYYGDWPFSIDIYNDQYIYFSMGATELGYQKFTIATTTFSSHLNDATQGLHIYKMHVDGGNFFLSGTNALDNPVLIRVNPLSDSILILRDAPVFIFDMVANGTDLWAVGVNTLFKYDLVWNEVDRAPLKDAPIYITYDSTRDYVVVGNADEVKYIPPWPADLASTDHFYARVSNRSYVTIYDTSTSSIIAEVHFDLNIQNISFANDRVMISTWKNNTGISHLLLDLLFPYVSLNRFDYEGNAFTDTKTSYIEIYLIGNQTDTVGVQKMTVEGDYLYAGSVLSLTGDAGRAAKINYIDFLQPTETRLTNDAENRVSILNSKFWSMVHYESTVHYIRVNFNWDWFSGFFEYSDYQEFMDQNSNLMDHTYKQTIERDDLNVVDQIRPLGTPKTPDFFIDQDDLSPASTLVAGVKLKYYFSYLFNDGSNSLLSKESQELEVPQLYSPLAVTIDTVTDYLNSAGHGLVAGDIVTIDATTMPTSTPQVTKNTYYYVIYVDANNFQLETIVGGGAINFTTTGTSVTVLQQNKQPIKVVIRDINLLDENGLTLYDIASVNKIQIYRSQKNVNEEWTAVVLLAELEKNNDDEWYYTPASPPYKEGVYEDNVQTLSYSPFTNANVFKYLAKNMVVHKNRLLLVNNQGLQTKNSNVVQYSELDNAQSLLPENIRSIQTGDSDILISAVSVGDYCYFFKTGKIYAILGDVATGQLIDVANTLGCPYRDMVIGYDNRVVYFLNQYGIYGIEAGRIVNIDQERIENYFDPDNEEGIDFTRVADNGFTFFDFKEKEVYFHVPQKGKTQNSLIIIYEVEHNRFKTYSYGNAPFNQKNIKDLETGNVKVIFSDYDGIIYEMSKQNNDDGLPVSYMVRTKQFNINSNFVNKKYKMLKVFGKFLKTLRVTYWIDGQRGQGILAHRKGYEGKDEATLFVTSHGLDNTIAIEISGEDTNDTPIEIEEVLIGYDNLRGRNR